MEATPATPPERSKTSYFDDQVRAVAFNKSFLKLLAVARNEVVSIYMSPENTHRLRHGGKFMHPGLPHLPEGGVQEHSSETTIPFEALVEHDLDVINRCLNKLTDDMKAQLAQMVYSTISEACDHSGNIVDARAAGSVYDAYVAMLEKIEFSVDSQGDVRLPELHMGPEAFKKLSEAMENVPPAILKRIDEIIERKKQAALDQDAKRKARFARYGEDQ